MTVDERGKIARDRVWQIHCGLCSTFTMLTPPPNIGPEAEARDGGWKKTREHGWICDECVRVSSRRGE